VVLALGGLALFGCGGSSDGAKSDVDTSASATPDAAVSSSASPTPLSSAPTSGPVSARLEITIRSSSNEPELDYKTGDVFTESLLLEGVCDGKGPCAVVLSHTFLFPVDDGSLVPTGSGYTKSWTGTGCGGPPNPQRFTMTISGAAVSGTYSNAGGRCNTKTEATFKGTIPARAG
jgi:hypothetical protein